MKARRILVALLLLLTIAAGTILRAQVSTLGREAYDALRERWAQVIGAPGAEDAGLVASGMIEARVLDIASPIGGRIAALHVVDGQQVAAGDVLAELDASLLDAQIAEARTAVAAARAQVALLRAGAREVDLAVAKAAVAQAEAARAAAYTAWQDALALVDAPGELDVQIAQATAALEVATEQAASADAAASAASLEQELWGRIVRSLEAGLEMPLPIPGGGTVHIDAPPERLAYASLQWNLASQRTWEAYATHIAAITARDTARQTLADLRRQRSEPVRTRSQADIASAAHTLAASAVATAEAGVVALQAGAPPEQIAAAETWVSQANAAVAALETKRAQARIIAPEAGTITAVILRAGEVAAPGTPIVRLADLAEVTVTVYVPEPRLGEVRLRQAVEVYVDSFPDRTFSGTIMQIAGRAEFSPKNVQSREDRATTVFAVRIVVPNPASALKPGMPADARFSADASPAALAASGPGSEPARDGLRDAISRFFPIRSAAQPAAAPYAGVIEATEVRVAAEVAGTVVRVHAGEGDAAAAGQVLAELDGKELAARRGQAQAALETARAELVRVAAAPQPARVAQAEAAVAQAEAALAVADAGLASARAQRDQPQELEARINSARGQVRAATAAIDVARAGLKTAQVLQESLPHPGSDEDRTRRAIYDQGVAASEAALRAAQAQERGARAVLAGLLAIREQPATADAAVHRAEGEVGKASAAMTAAGAVLAQAQAPPRPEVVAIAEASVAQAEAALAALDAAAAKLAVRSPIDGTITARAIQAGEVAQPVAALFSVIDLRQVRLVIYVPTGQIGQVRLGQDAEVTIDAYPGRVFVGRVARIADQAEFTPKNVQTQAERVMTVFAVEIALDNQDGLLRPGMPADAELAQ